MLHLPASRDGRLQAALCLLQGRDLTLVSEWHSDLDYSLCFLRTDDSVWSETCSEVGMWDFFCAGSAG